MPHAPSGFESTNWINGECIWIEGCPHCFLNRNPAGYGWYNFFDLYRHYTAGFLLDDGGIDSQAAVYLDAMSIIRGLNDSYTRHLQRKHEQEMNRQR